jgi:hypothetical protein
MVKVKNNAMYSNIGLKEERKEMNKILKTVILTILLLGSSGAFADKSFWLANKMISKKTDVPALFKDIPKGSVISILPKWIPRACDFKYEIEQFENKVFTVASCVYIGNLREKS